MSNINNISLEKIKSFCIDYSQLCRKHNLYLVIDDDAWLQQSGDEQDLDDIYDNMMMILDEQ